MTQPKRTFSATDRGGFGIQFLATGWEEAEAVAQRNGFTGLGLLVCVYPADDETTKWAADRSAPN